MKVVGSILRALFSLILTVLLVVSLLVTGVVKPIVDFFNPEVLSSAINKTVTTVVEDIKQIDLSKPESEMTAIEITVKEAVQSLEDSGISQDAITGILEDEELSGMVTDVLSDVVLNMVDPSHEVKMPEKEAVLDIIVEKKELVKEFAQEGVNIDELSDEELRKNVEENYDAVMEQVQEYLKQIGGAINE